MAEREEVMNALLLLKPATTFFLNKVIHYTYPPEKGGKMATVEPLVSGVLP